MMTALPVDEALERLTDNFSNLVPSRRQEISEVLNKVSSLRNSLLLTPVNSKCLGD